ncbi:MAG TPA: hypothetical protein VGU72_04375 [Beijerinckiaceae bacterium]|nr:hypothetical protein [Beijerinckiaceae bacterium]
MTRIGSTVITKPDQRTPLVEGIIAEEAAFGVTPLVSRRALQRGYRS